MNHLARIESNPDVMLGKPVIKGTRITVELILKKLASGFSMEQILKSYDHLTKEDILASIDYAADVISNEEMIELK
ncbi:MAG: DUF433 domain-containing protein [Ignavibacteria bacterium]|nr:DUF433 domain-containing protein [Ignavibacteria bacterium]